MNKKSLIVSIVAVVLSFIGGFILANALNRSEITSLQGELGGLKAAPTPAGDGSETTLSEEEIRDKIAEADRNPQNIDFQKNLAIGLYRYANMKQESRWLPDVARILSRVVDNNPKDFNAVASLANIYFDIANEKQDNETFKKSRELYKKALEVKPNDVETQTDLGLTYLMEKPADEKSAIAAFEKSLKIDPKNEKALQNMIQAQIGVGNPLAAEQFLNRLKEANPNNEAISELTAKLAEKSGNTKK